VQGYIETHVAKVAGVLTQFKTGTFPLLSPAVCSIFTNSSVFVEIMIKKILVSTPISHIGNYDIGTTRHLLEMKTII
jgi:hypothetical protein